MEQNPKASGVRLILLASGILLIFNLRNLMRFLRITRIARSPSTAPQSAASIWYGRMLKLVHRRGYRRGMSQTPAEFVASISDPDLRKALREFTEHYEHARFGDSSEDAERLPELYRKLRSGDEKRL
jgi:hypothetical protein